MSDAVTAYLDDIEKRNRAFGEGAPDVPRLLAALNAVMELCADWNQKAKRLDEVADPDAPSVPLKRTRAAAYEDCAGKLEQVISRTLLGP